jgi:hypothetical protein
MTEVLFILTIVFGAYVFCVTTTTFRDTKTLPATEPEKPTVAIAESFSSTSSEILSTTTQAAPKSTASKPASNKKPSASTKNTANTKKGLKNPETGEIATSYANYRFTKRWIKDALVAEGLLEKVYKNNELNDETEFAIKTAITKLEKLKKYKA